MFVQFIMWNKNSKHNQGYYLIFYDINSQDSIVTDCEKHGWKWCVSLNMDHGHNIWQLPFSRSHKEQSGKKTMISSK